MGTNILKWRLKEDETEMDKCLQEEAVAYSMVAAFTRSKTLGEHHLVFPTLMSPACRGRKRREDSKDVMSETDEKQDPPSAFMTLLY